MMQHYSHPLKLGEPFLVRATGQTQEKKRRGGPREAGVRLASLRLVERE